MPYETKRFNFEITRERFSAVRSVDKGGFYALGGKILFYILFYWILHFVKMSWNVWQE